MPVLINSSRCRADHSPGTDRGVGNSSTRQRRPGSCWEATGKMAGPAPTTLKVGCRTESAPTAASSRRPRPVILELTLRLPRVCSAPRAAHSTAGGVCTGAVSSSAAARRWKTRYFPAWPWLARWWREPSDRLINGMHPRQCVSLGISVSTVAKSRGQG